MCGIGGHVDNMTNCIKAMVESVVSFSVIGKMMNDPAVPLSRQRLCTYCQCRVDSNAAGVYQLATGWLMNRRQGGTNAIALPVRQDHYACHECVDKLKHGIPVGQMQLFGIEGFTDGT